MKHRRLNILLLVLLLLILLPALLYTGFELSRLNKTEETLSGVYAQQLDAVLFSINQYSWDITGSWFAEIQGSLLREEAERGTASILEEILEKHTAILTAALFDSSAQVIASARRLDDAATQLLEQRIADSLATRRNLLSRLLRYREELYYKMEPLRIPVDSGSTRLCLSAVVVDGEGRGRFAAVSINAISFIRRVLSPKLQELAGDNLRLSCIDRRTGEVLLSTSGRAEKQTLQQSRGFWLFPEYELAISLQGQTVKEIAQDRFQSNALLLSIIDLLLIAGVIVVYRSVRKEMELAALKSDFVSNVSHELKTPLALIRMFAETLEMDRVRDEAQRKEYYGIIVQETERLTRLINNILTFSRIEAGKKDYRFASVDIDAVVREVMTMYSFHLEHKGFSTSMELETSLPRVQADEEAVAEALINLLDNAMKYSEDVKEVQVRTGRDGGYIFIEVLDSGIGIAPEHRSRVFEKFYRVSEGLVHTAKGSGLGLSLVQHIMQAHGGSVQVESTPGKGSTFRLRFPINAAQS
ncbi:HAMP domain-containing histidine kinase [bacterium]|nr:HAMP domain-containing histidine kinase [bacterium]